MFFPMNLPNELIQSGCFCYWKYENRSGKQTKVPYNPQTDEMAKSNDKNTFCRYELLKPDAPYTGVGIGIFDGICAIDLDHCITETGALNEFAKDVVAIMHSYTEKSPSGHGLHILFRANNFQYDTHRYYIMNRKIGMEIYVAGATSKYVTITGNSLTAHQDFGDRSQELQLVLDKYMQRSDAETFSENIGINGVNGVNVPDTQESALTDDEIIFRLCNLDLWQGDCTRYPSHSEADMALCAHLAFWTSRDFRQMDRLFRRSGLMRDKWDRVQSGSTYGAITINKAIAQCREAYRKPAAKITDNAKLAVTQEESEFAPLIPLEQECAHLPSFPVDALPTIVGDFVKAVAENTQTSADMAATISLGVMASCLQGKYVIQPKQGYQEPLNLYTMIIAAPGERKSSVLREMTEPLYNFEKQSNEQMSNEIRNNQLSRESLERKIDRLTMKLKRKEDEATEQELLSLKNQLHDLPELLPPRYFADDCTCEALTSLMAANHGRLSVISSEGGIFDILTGRYSDKVNIDTWLKSHSGDTIRVDRLGRPSDFILHPALTAILTIQPSVLSNIMENSTLDGRGLLARFLYCMPPSRIGCRSFLTPAVPVGVKAAYEKLVFHLMQLPQQESPNVLTLSADALTEMEHYFLKHEQFLANEGQDMIEWASKYIGTVLRIAGLLHVTDGHADAEVQTETLHRAIAIGEFFLEQSKYAFSLMGVDESVRKAKSVLIKIKQEKISAIKRCDLFRLCRNKYFKKAEDIMPTLALLENNGYIRQLPPDASASKGRKPDVLIRVNPLVISTA